QVRHHLGAFRQSHDDHRVRNLGGESRMIHLVHDVEAEDFAAPGDGDPFRIGRQALRADRAGGKTVRTARRAPLHAELVELGTLEEGAHVGSDDGNGFHVFGHAHIDPYTYAYTHTAVRVRVRVRVRVPDIRNLPASVIRCGACSGTEVGEHQRRVRREN